MADTVRNTEFLVGGGVMGALIRDFDWANASLGPPEDWPQSLRAMIRLILNTRHPMFVWWGDDLIQFYNDAYSETMGPERHPGALGDRGRDCWAEIWPIIGPQIAYVMAGNGSTWDEDRLVPVTRHGKREDVWWTYSYSPIDEGGAVGGVLVICNDVTRQHLATAQFAKQVSHLEELFQQAPGFMAVLRGPDHVFEFTNNAYQALTGHRNIVGRPLREAVPEIAGQGFLELLDTVFAKGEARTGKRMPLFLQPDLDAAIKELFVDFVYQPIFDEIGSVSGIFVEGFEVTAHVEAETHLRLMNDELKHRVKNTIAMVTSIASQTLRSAEYSPSLKAFYDRLANFGRAHDMLTATTWATASFGDVVRGILQPYNEDQRFTISGPEIVIGAKQALSLSLALHELTTNAVK